MLGVQVDRAQADELFDTFDDDGSGSIEYGEMSKKMREHNKRMLAAAGGVRRLRKSSSRRSVGEGVSYESVREAAAEELEARRALMKVQRLYRLAEHEEAMANIRKQKEASGSSVRKETDERVGRDLTARIMAVPMATREEQAELAEQLHTALDGRAWYQLFKEV